MALWIEGKGGRKRRDYGVEFWSEGGREGGMRRGEVESLTCSPERRGRGWRGRSSRGTT